MNKWKIWAGVALGTSIILLVATCAAILTQPEYIGVRSQTYTNGTCGICVYQQWSEQYHAQSCGAGAVFEFGIKSPAVVFAALGFETILVALGGVFGYSMCRRKTK